MKITDLITDAKLESVFENTRFGSRDFREIVLTSLTNVNDGYHIGYTAKCCLIELGLVDEIRPRKLKVTVFGKKYLKAANDEQRN